MQLKFILFLTYLLCLFVCLIDSFLTEDESNSMIAAKRKNTITTFDETQNEITTIKNNTEVLSNLHNNNDLELPNYLRLTSVHSCFMKSDVSLLLFIYKLLIIMNLLCF